MKNKAADCKGANSPGEQEVIRRILGGETQAFAELVRDYSAHVFMIVSHMVSSQEVEEVAHEVFIRAFRDLSGYRAEAPFEHWLSKIAVRTCYDYWRKQRRQKVSAVPEERLAVLEREAQELTSNENAAVERAKELLDWAFSHLTPEDRLVFSLLYLDDMSMKEAAQMLGWSVARVKIRSYRARQLMRKRLQNRREE